MLVIQFIYVNAGTDYHSKPNKTGSKFIETKKFWLELRVVVKPLQVSLVCQTRLVTDAAAAIQLDV